MLNNWKNIQWICLFKCRYGLNLDIQFASSAMEYTVRFSTLNTFVGASLASN